MIPDVSLNGVSMLSLGWCRESISFPPPAPQSETVTVPGRNSPIRYYDALGRVSYEPREFEILLTMLGSRAEFNALVSETVNPFLGQLVEVICNEESDLYVVGTVSASTSYDPLTGRGELEFSCSDADSYRYHVDETVVEITGSGTVELENDYMPVVPTVVTTDETVLAWTMDDESYQTTLSAGTWEIPELELQAGTNSISISGEGTTTFTYREGRL